MKEIFYTGSMESDFFKNYRKINIAGYQGYCHPDIYDFLIDGFNQFRKENIVPHVLNKNKRSKFIHWKLPSHFLGINELTCKVFEPKGFWRNFIGLFKKSKAERSFNSACFLQSRGLDTPLPFAWLVKRKFRLIRQGIYITERIEQFKKVKRILRKEKPDPQLIRQIIKKVADYVLIMHNSGMIHRDLNLANFLLTESKTSYRLLLIDLNRARFYHNISSFRRMKDITRLYWKEHENSFLTLYCKENKNLQRLFPFVEFYQRWRKLRRKFINYFK